MSWALKWPTSEGVCVLSLLRGCGEDCLCAWGVHKVGMCARCVHNTCASSLFSVCLCALYLVHNECSVSLRRSGFMMMISFPSFPDVESETQNFEILSKSESPTAVEVKARVPFAWLTGRVTSPLACQQVSRTECSMKFIKDLVTACQNARKQCQGIQTFPKKQMRVYMFCINLIALHAILYAFSHVICKWDLQAEASHTYIRSNYITQELNAAASKPNGLGMVCSVWILRERMGQYLLF